ncbi:class I SAM-dependent methyltransferase [Lichenibacterium dinghuense]|uniref:class I SAM-dependent methyltransferase n=1 Tax=Lichenibacterium dinghuense TaxID=2895977 RepID=UPI001F2448BF|nr:class I SAM-dependent methyltransferase [Lichenibacterium sp. 6Y81]
MSDAQNSFTADHYAPRAQAYVDSRDHSQGADLDEMEDCIRGAGLGRALDLGCGGGHVSYRAAPHVGAVVACDVTPAMLDAVARTAAGRGLANVETRRAGAEALPFADAEFDAVLCRFTAHHWADVEAGLREARRVLKPGGLAVFMDAVAPPDRAADTHLQAVELLRDASHVRDYAVSEWLAMLGRAGFAVERVTRRKLRMVFPVWIARTAVPPATAGAIRALQDGASPAVRAHFAISEDGSFDLDTATMVGRAA